LAFFGFAIRGLIRHSWQITPTGLVNGPKFVSQAKAGILFFKQPTKEDFRLRGNDG
jgi:hypothetical protein